MRRVEDLSTRTLRELLILARQRLGSAASTLKTREEVLGALQAKSEAPALPAPASQPLLPVDHPPRELVAESVVTRDFFRRQG